MPDPATPDVVNMVSPDGRTYAVPREKVAGALDQRFTYENEGQAHDRVRQEAVQRMYGGTAGTIVGGALGLARGVSLGGSDAALRALGAGDDARDIRDVNPGASTVGDLVGSIYAPGIGELGSAIREGGGVARGIKAGAAEGALLGAGQGVSDVALSEDPITFERVAGSLSSNALFGGLTGGVVGGAVSGIEKGLSRAKGALDEAAARGVGPESAEVSGDLVGKSSRELADLRDAELTRIEGERVPQRKALADDIGAFRRELKEDKKLFLATKGIKETALPEGMEGALKLQEIGKISLEADKTIDRTLRNPIALEKNPRRALDALQQQEGALMQLQKREATLRELFAADESGARAAALDAVPDALEKNRALQKRIADLADKPASPRLAAIDNAKEALSIPTPPESTGTKLLKGLAFGKVSAVVGMTPLAPLAHIAGAKAADMIGDLMAGKLAAATRAAAERSSNAIDAFVTGAKAAAPIAPIVATKVLAAKRYAAGKAESAPKGAEPLADLYAKRSAEVRSQTAYNAMGQPEMRPEARRAMAAQLDPIRKVSPVAADRLETLAAARIEYLSSKLPRRPDLPMALGAPDLWHPSDMQMRQWARFAAAADDPGGVEERLANGTITPEDAEAYRTLYPERFAHVTNAITAALANPEKGAKQLGYQKRVALSIFTGQAMDPALNPVVLKVLQGQFAEPGTAGGTQQPTPQPQFGSVKKSVDGPTPGQSRETGQESE